MRLGYALGGAALAAFGGCHVSCADAPRLEKPGPSCPGGFVLQDGTCVDVDAAADASVDHAAETTADVAAEAADAHADVGAVCVAEWGTCAVQGDCCAGLECRVGEGGLLRCLSPAPLCGTWGDECNAPADCCVGYECFKGWCQIAPCNVDDCDGDGWTKAAGDCCDVPGPCGANPEKINPGAVELLGNSVDDDCDGTGDQVKPSCDALLLDGTSPDPVDYARAMDLCKLALTEKDWGIVSAELTLADGKLPALAESHAVRPGFGAAILPLNGARLAVLSTGVAADVGDQSPSWSEAPWQPGTAHGTKCPLPGDWLAANGNVVPTAPGCPPPDPVHAHDSVMLTLLVRAPSNVSSFGVSMFFLSSEFPEFACSGYNDVLVALLEAGVNTNPPDRNLAFFRDAAQLVHPIGSSLAGSAGADFLFPICAAGQTGCLGGKVSVASCSGGTTLLQGTGFDAVSVVGCGGSKLVGGGTGWLHTRGNVAPGALLQLRIALWDSGDALHDSAVLLDNWTWRAEVTKPGTAP